MHNLKCSHMSIFVITLEVAIAVISLIPLSAVFAFVGYLALKNEGPDKFYPAEIEPLLTAAGTVFITIYVLQAVQLLAGILLLKSFTLMDINLWRTLKTAWCWLMSSIFTLCALAYLIFQTVVIYESNAFFLFCLITFLLQKTMSFTFVGGFTIGACIVVINEHKD